MDVPVDIPVVDFSNVFSCLDLSVCPQVKEINSALSSVGFVFITNHGIRRSLVSISESSRIYIAVTRAVISSQAHVMYCKCSYPGRIKLLSLIVKYCLQSQNRIG